MAKNSAVIFARHLIAVARRAMKHGDARPAEINLARYRRLAEEETDAADRGALMRVVRVFGRVISRRPKTAAEKIAAMPQGFVPPTPETSVKARRTADPVDLMQLTPLQRRAADEIRIIYEELTRSLQVKGLNLNTDRVDTSMVVRDPGETMREDLQENFVEYFLPWWRRHSKIRYKRRRSIDIVFVVLFEMVPLWMIDDALKLQSGQASAIVRRALSDYWQGNIDVISKMKGVGNE